LQFELSTNGNSFDDLNKYLHSGQYNDGQIFHINYLPDNYKGQLNSGEETLHFREMKIPEQPIYRPIEEIKMVKRKN